MNKCGWCENEAQPELTFCGLCEDCNSKKWHGDEEECLFKRAAKEIMRDLKSERGGEE